MTQRNQFIYLIRKVKQKLEKVIFNVQIGNGTATKQTGL